MCVVLAYYLTTASIGVMERREAIGVYTISVNGILIYSPESEGGLLTRDG